jgi:phosphate/sulfate permease
VLALMVGAPIAGGVHLVAATTRVKSSVVSAGTLNPVASTVEDGLTLGAIAVAIFAPLLALALAILLLVLVGRFVAKRLRRPA